MAGKIGGDRVKGRGRIPLFDGMWVYVSGVAVPDKVEASDYKEVVVAN